MQENLFTSQESVILPGGGELVFLRGWLARAEADEHYQTLMNSTQWSQPDIRIAGKLHKIPRKQAWYGEQGTGFSYSGQYFEPIPFSPLLERLNRAVTAEVSVAFNSVLVNLYRDEADSVGWHADDESEFGEHAKIASLSLGETRRFQLKPKQHHLETANWRKGQRSLSFALHHGDLLLMSAGVQDCWLHCVPKERLKCDPRINLTFRRVILGADKL